MKNLFLFVAIMYVLSLTAAAQDPGLEGDWIAVNERTRGITRIRISQDERGPVIEAWGKCHPMDCVWGATRLAPVGDSVEDVRFVRGFAVWDPGFATKYVNVVYKRNTLIVETTTIFNDRSQRSNFRAVEVMRREGTSDLER